MHPRIWVIYSYVCWWLEKVLISVSLMDSWQLQPSVRGVFTKRTRSSGFTEIWWFKVILGMILGCLIYISLITNLSVRFFKKKQFHWSYGLPELFIPVFLSAVLCWGVDLVILIWVWDIISLQLYDLYMCLPIPGSVSSRL